MRSLTLLLLADNRCDILDFLEFLLNGIHVTQAVDHDTYRSFKESLLGFNHKLVDIHVHLARYDIGDLTQRSYAVQALYVDGYREQAVLNLPLNGKDTVAFSCL